MVTIDANDRILSQINLSLDAAKENEEIWKKEIATIQEQRALIKQGGGPANIEKQHKKNRLTAKKSKRKNSLCIENFKKKT